MQNSFQNRHRHPGDPAVTAFDITPSDTDDLAHVTTGLNVATPGTIRVTTVDGSIVDLTVASGQVFPICATRVWLSGTSATEIRGLL